ncbi:MAG: NADH-quinone oxidoreductase subunit NuoH [Anaerolineales bacterium]|jgi:NADH-quinone oxidoreductase subunit H|uniref:NADH-quinone oxidoreductase subunit NuoH n=1 Tax=Candidatus Villigracilis affinis TaxID=3140682 RepID=UPI001B6A9520|nr:NADH-quinone oxidoreductase subunit NuoH [Anaerolineales bacterium]MBK9604128.1 NADH-quinone oxidoreductase subunit NuoH [Anaerolineales bacterium]MBL0348193.1 NADH-quinone oxidoreductase subunit NuoH [Anaerolineales bacterium]MBP8047531.1 NADH-quinone oxidoreductase subunit NuoH [Anaerolineales bacterium]
MDWTIWLEWVLKGFILCLILLTGFAYLTLYERRALARMQVRVGPNRAGPQGLLQPIADAVKLIFKEEFTPSRVYKVVFVLAPILTVVPSLILAAVIPLGSKFMLFGREITLYVADLNVGVLYLTSIASIAVYGIVLAGWSSNNKYAMLGGIRSSAQMISYELSLGLCIVIAILLGDSMNLNDIVNAQKGMWFAVIQPAGALVFMIVTLAEVNRAPFDMPEAEQELTAGYHAEYSGMKFALFFMAEYQKMIVICMIAATLFFGGYREFWFLQGTIFSVDRFWFLGPIYLLLKVVVLLFFMIWIRATWPRIRYDRLMAFGWKVLLPLSLILAFITATGILLAKELNNQLFFWSIPVLSIICVLVAVVFINSDLRRKSHGRI